MEKNKKTYNDKNLIISNISNYIKNKTDDKNIKNKNKNKFNYNPNNSLGIYIPYTLINSDLSFEFLDETSFIIKNINRNSGKLNEVFKWKNTLDRKITNLMYIYVHITTIPLYPFINKTLVTDFDVNIKTILLSHNTNKKLKIDMTIENITIAYFDDNIIDFILNNNNNNLYSIELNMNNVYLYTRSIKKITDNPFLYLDIDSNDNLNNNYSFNSSYIMKKFNFKLVPIKNSDTYVFYKGMGQYLLKTLNELVNIDNFTVQLYDSTYKPLINNYINKNLYNNTECLCNSNNTNITNASCYCNYIRHPLNKNNQIDIGFKIGQIKNELLNNTFY
jgi:hypothetical protein